MEHSLVGVFGKNNRLLLSKLLCIIYLFSPPWVYITLVLRQSHGTIARMHGYEKTVKILCVTEHRGKVLTGTGCIRNRDGIQADMRDRTCVGTLSAPLAGGCVSADG